MNYIELLKMKLSFEIGSGRISSIDNTADGIKAFNSEQFKEWFFHNFVDFEFAYNFLDRDDRKIYYVDFNKAYDNAVLDLNMVADFFIVKDGVFMFNYKNINTEKFVIELHEKYLSNDILKLKRKYDSK